MNKSILIYDDNCDFCLSIAINLKQKAGTEDIELLSIYSENLPEPVASISKDELQKQMHLLLSDGQILRGSDAAAYLLSYYPKWAWLGRLMRYRLFAPVASIGYRVVAKLRQRIW